MPEYNDFRRISLFTLMENQKFQYRSVIKFLVLKGESPPNLCKHMAVVYGSHASSRTTAFGWARRFIDGQLNIEDNPRRYPKITATNNEIVEV